MQCLLVIAIAVGCIALVWLIAGFCFACWSRGWAACKEFLTDVVYTPYFVLKVAPLLSMVLTALVLDKIFPPPESATS